MGEISYLLLLTELLVDLSTLRWLIAVVSGLSMTDQSLLPLILIAGIGRLHQIRPLLIRPRAMMLMLMSSRTRSGSHVCWDMLLPCLIVVVVARTYWQCGVLLCGGLLLVLFLLRLSS